MDPQLDQRLSAIEKKIDQNTAIVQKLRGSQRRAAMMKYVYWGIVIALSIFSFVMIKPFLSQLKDAYGLGGTNSTKNTSTASYSDVLNSLK